MKTPAKCMFLIRDEVLEIKAKYADPRRTVIVDEEAGTFSNEDLIPHQEVVVTVSHGGYIKRILKDTYRVQRRGWPWGGGNGYPGGRRSTAPACWWTPTTSCCSSRTRVG